MTIRISAAVVCCLITTVYSAIAPGENAYLPPKEGYSYPRPSVPFPAAPQPPARPSRPSFGLPSRPPQASIPPSFAPSPNPYKPAGPPTSPIKPGGPGQTQAPSYVPPPTQPPYRPPPRPPATPGYLPPPQSRPPPSYGPPTSPTLRPQPPRPQPPRPQPPRPQPHPTYGPPARPGPYPPSRPSLPPSEGGPFKTFGENDHLLEPHKPGNPFDFKYEVKDEFGNDYSHNAINDGDTTNGEYRVQLPDGRTQVVKYTANWATGFQAKISYEGQPTYNPPGGGGYPSQRPSGPSFPAVPAGSGGNQNYAPGGGYSY
ncbi:uncharacterized protein [Euwallacea fornicatus]|uniref:uncharacterized protein isoform X2 n=1 Tax=Euwallacea fornicatus TaxID=995702 RepID=UPI003390369B